MNILAVHNSLVKFLRKSL